MPKVLDIINEHRVIRKYKLGRISENHINLILKAGLRAPSAGNLQPYRIIMVEDMDKRKAIRDIAGDMNHIVEASVFLIFIADVRRLINSLKALGYETIEPNLYALYDSTIAAALAAQNITLVAEALGYGICYIGAIQNDPCKVIKLLNLPKETYPLFGLTIGYPDERPEIRPRLPLNMMFCENTYEGDEHYNIKKVIEHYKSTGYIDTYMEHILHFYSRGGVFKKRYGSMKKCLLKQSFKV